jgi:signal transduction histidine kinase
LEALRAERNLSVGEREDVDLVEIAREACQSRSIEPHRCILDAEKPVVGEYDAMRMWQLLDNLLENAAKYSPGAARSASGSGATTEKPI